MQKDKTTLEISEELHQYIEALAEEVVLKGEPFENHKKHLRRFCETEGLDYDTLENNLTNLFETLGEWKTYHTKSSSMMARLLARECYLLDAFVNKLLFDSEKDNLCNPNYQEQETDAELEKNTSAHNKLSYMKSRSGDIFDEMPGGNLLRQEQPRFFIFDKYVEEAFLTPKRKTLIDNYKKKYGIKMDSVFENHSFYKDYLSKFDFKWELVTPEETDYISSKDWDLLTRLILGSFASSYSLVLDERWAKKPEGKARIHISITVSNDNRTTTKLLDELWPFQIFTLFSSYIDEQIQLITSLTTEEDLDYLQNIRESQVEKFINEEKEITNNIKKALDNY